MSEVKVKGSGLMKSIEIHNKDYYEVKERVMEFHRLYPNGSITTEILEASEKRFITRTTATPDVSNPERKFVGLAYENVGKGIMSTSALECCETSSVGRALGFLDIGIEGGIASADEVRSAIDNQDKPATENQINAIKKMCVNNNIESIKCDFDKLMNSDIQDFFDAFNKKDFKKVQELLANCEVK